MTGRLGSHKREYKAQSQRDVEEPAAGPKKNQRDGLRTQNRGKEEKRKKGGEHEGVRTEALERSGAAAGGV